MSVVEEICAEIDPARVFRDPLDLLTYQRDCSVVTPGQASVLVRPNSSAEISSVLKRAQASGTPVYARGAGTMYAGGVNPAAGGVVLDLSGMDRILEIDPARGVVVVEPGVRFGSLSQALKPFGLTVGIIPSTAPTATVGGAASAHALGTGSARHQSFADEVVGLQVVLPDGRVIETGSAAARGKHFHRFGMGPDLTGLFLGGDGTLGVITAIALWLHPLPAFRTTACHRFPDAQSAAGFIAALQSRELMRNVWYASGYEAGTIKGRVLAARPDHAPQAWPGFCVGLDFGGDEPLVRHDMALIADLSAEHGGAPFPLFDEVYFNHLRNEEIYWYGYAGYFSRSRCAILMSSLATPDLPRFLDSVQGLRESEPAFLWGGAVVICRRGLHGGVLAFYDEANQWPEAQAAAARAAARLVEAGCTPYKTGKIWAGELQEFTAYHQTLTQLKHTFDPPGILSPGNLGLGLSARDADAPLAAPRDSRMALDPDFVLHPQLVRDFHVLGRCGESRLHVLLRRNAVLPWFLLVPETSVQELFELPPPLRQDLEARGDVLARFVKAHFNSDKINVAAIGNIVPQLHLHVIGRQVDDCCWPLPAWGHLQGKASYSAETLANLTTALGSLPGFNFTAVADGIPSQP